MATAALISAAVSLVAQQSGISMSPVQAQGSNDALGALSGGYYTFQRAVTAKDVQQTSPNDPINETRNFVSTDSMALAWSHLVNLYKPVRLKAVWIGPSGDVYYTNTGSWSSDPATSGYLYWTWWRFWSWIYIRNFPPANPGMWGAWTVQMYFEENYSGIWNLDTTMTFQIAGPTSVHASDAAPLGFALSQNYPNPFNPATTISFTLPLRSFVSLKVLDLLGREVATIVSEELAAGSYTQQWNAGGLPSAIYLYRLQAGSFAETKKLVLLR
jgi:hypothetical protein